MKQSLTWSSLSFWLLVLSLATLADPGPLDGVWQDERGNRVTIVSEVVHATVLVESPQRESRQYRARYVGYTSLLVRDAGSSPLRIDLAGADRLYFSGPNFSGFLERG